MRRRRNQLGIQRQHAAVFREAVFTRREGTVLDLVPFEDGLCFQNVFDVGGIVDSRQLDEYLGGIFVAAGGLDGGFGETEPVDLTLDGEHGLLHRVVPDLQRGGGLDGHAPLARTAGRGVQVPVLEGIGDEAAEISRAGGGNALDVDFDFVGVLDTI